jgi:uncharacterized delta-60 repeat protein
MDHPAQSMPDLFFAPLMKNSPNPRPLRFAIHVSRLLTAWALTLPMVVSLASAQNGPGDWDPGFDPGAILASGGTATIHAMVVESDGDVIVVGDFTTIGGVTRGRIAKIKANGSLDPSFASAAGADGPIYCVAVQQNGGILIGGDFQNYNGTARSRIARLTSSGSLDTFFNPGSGADGPVYAIAEAANEIWAGGDFTHYNGIGLNRIVQLSGNGMPKTIQYLPGGCDGPVRVLLVDPSYLGSIYIGGEFLNVGGQSRPYLARASYYGALDAPLTDGVGPDGPVLCMAMEFSDPYAYGEQALYIGGSFTAVDGQPRGGLARIMVDSYSSGDLDSFFSLWVGGVVRGLVPQRSSPYEPPTGLVITGDFDAVNGHPKNHVARVSLTAVESADLFYNSGVIAQVDTTYAAGGGLSAPSLAAGNRSDGLIYVAGSFENVSDSPRTALARLYGEYGGSLPGIPGSPSALALSSDAIVIHWAPASNAASHRIERSPNGIDSWTNRGSATTSFTDQGLDPGVEYFYRVTGSNPNGLGTPSAVVSATTDPVDWTGPGSPDLAASALNVNSTVYATALQPDGKILIAGSFSSVGGVTKNRIARLNPDWTVDVGFDAQGGPNSTVYAIDIAADGKIIIGGTFTSVNGVPRNHVARLHPDGSLDSNFDPGPGASSSVYSVAAQADGGVLIGGGFSQVSGYNQDYVARLLPDGSLDLAFRASPNSFVYCLEVLPDGRILIGGSFSQVTGVPLRGVARLLPDGAIDPSFTPGSGGATVYAMDWMSDGRIVIGGTFTSFSGQTRRRVARLLEDGTLDPGFDPGTGPNSTVEAVAVDGNGRVIIGGSFTTVAGGNCFRLARLESDGSLDNSFRTGAGFSSTVETVLLDEDGKVVVGGSFSSSQGGAEGRVVRLLGGSIEPLSVMTGDPLPAATTSSHYSYPIMAAGGAPPYEWSVVAGALPDGLALHSGGTLTGQPSTPGSETVTLRVTDWLGTMVDQEFHITVVAGQPLDYAAWVDLHFTLEEAADPSVSGADIDWDSDGLDNLLESAFGGNPKIPDAATHEPTISVGDGHCVFTFFCDANRTDIDYTVETTTNPSAIPWTEIAVSLAGGIVGSTSEECVVSDPGGGLRLVTVTGSLPISAEPAKFFRIRIVRNE